MHNDHFLAQFKGWLKKHGVPEYYSCADKKGFLRDHIMSLSLEEFATEFGYLCVRKKPGPKLTAMKKTKTSGKPRTPVEPDNTDPPAHPGPQSHSECAQCGRPHYPQPHPPPYAPPYASPYAPPYAPHYPQPQHPQPYASHYPQPQQPQHAQPYASHYPAYYPPQHAPPYAPPYASYYPPQHAPPQHAPQAPPQHAPQAPPQHAPQYAPPQHTPSHEQFAPQYPPRPESLNAANLEQPDENYDVESSDSNTSAELPAMWFHGRRAKTAAASRIYAQSLS